MIGGSLSPQILKNRHEPKQYVKGLSA
jgi:hypothetical protein